MAGKKKVGRKKGSHHTRIMPEHLAKHVGRKRSRRKRA